jgi:hypothetical protein
LRTKKEAADREEKEAVDWEQRKKRLILDKEKAVAGKKKTLVDRVRGSVWCTILASCGASRCV